MTISPLKLCQRWGFWKTRACLLGVAGLGCEMQDRLLNSPSVIVSWIMTSNKGCSVHASSPIVANSCFVHGDDYVGLGVRGDLEGCKAKLSERFIIKDRRILGADGLHEIRILNRVITYHPAKPGCPEMLPYSSLQMDSMRRARPRQFSGTKQLSWLGMHWQDHSWTRSDESSSAATA